VISLSLSLPPSANALYRNVTARERAAFKDQKKLGRAKTERYKAWLRSAGNEILATPLDRRSSVKGPFVLTVLIGRHGDMRQHDLDNLLKATLDLLQAHGLVENDCFAESIKIDWARTVQKGRIEVRVWPVGPATSLALLRATTGTGAA